MAAETRRRREQLVRLGAFVTLGLVAVGVVAWLILGQRAGDLGGSAGLPGPSDEPSITQDVGTLVGQSAPGFTLSDAAGQDYTVTPGQGRPIVLVSHMGIT